MKNKDWVEEEYERAIKHANWRGDYDTAYDLSVGLKEYRLYYKVEE